MGEVGFERKAFPCLDQKRFTSDGHFKPPLQDIEQFVSRVKHVDVATGTVGFYDAKQTGELRIP
jgi:hypothetical protein